MYQYSIECLRRYRREYSLNRKSFILLITRVYAIYLLVKKASNTGTSLEVVNIALIFIRCIASIAQKSHI